jgi:hypothetical protein
MARQTQFNQGGTLSNPINSPYVRLLALGSRLGSYVGLRGLPGGVELDALYVDLIVRRYEAATGDPPILLGTGELRRATEAASVYDRVRRAFGGRP